MELDGTQRVILRITALIVSCTLMLTAGFIGFIATLSGEVVGFESRVPWYLVGAAIVFVSTIVLLEINDAAGRTILVSALVVSALSFVLLFLSVEGFVFTLKNPETLFTSRLVLYFFAAALVATGVGYWGLRHWREFAADQRESL
jgi:FlaA1/EpsC-like NDP-sugar epimerase